MPARELTLQVGREPLDGLGSPPLPVPAIEDVPADRPIEPDRLRVRPTRDPELGGTHPRCDLREPTLLARRSRQRLPSAEARSIIPSQRSAQ